MKMFANKEKLKSNLILITKIFLVGLVLQFFVQTLFTFEFGLEWTFWSIVWMWKELIILGFAIIAAIIIKQKNNIKEIRDKVPIKKFTIVLWATLIVSFIVSILITKSGLGNYVFSVKYDLFWYIIFIIFFVLAWLFFNKKEEKLLKRYNHGIKWLIMWSIAWRGIIWLVPRLLDFVGYNKNVFEWDVGVEPPAVYYTQLNQGLVRNQFLFERPISRGFFLIAFWPLFFLLSVGNKGRKNIVWRGGLYGIAVFSTFSRAAWIAFIVQTIILLMMQYRKQFWKLALYMFVPLILLFAGATYISRDQIIEREYSNTWHLELLVEAVNKVKEKPLFGRWAGSAGPVTHHTGDPADEYNPENQYLQIWIEYGIFWFAGWAIMYIWLLYVGYKAYRDIHTHKQSKNVRHLAWMVFAFSLGLFGLSIEGLVLHSFVDRMIVYPFMALFAITYAIYYKEANHIE